MAIESVALIGMGAMGILLGSQMIDHIEPERLRVIAGPKRIKNYEEEIISANGKEMKFQFVSSEQMKEPVDLAIFAVKYGGLPQAISDMRYQIDDHTTIISVLNGIVSEEDLSKAYRPEQVIPVVAQGMDATREGRTLTYSRTGELVLPAHLEGQEERLLALKEFFDRMGIAWIEVEDIHKHLWSKFMFNTGINQVVGIYGGGYGIVQKDGEARRQMIQAMREVLPIAEAEGVHLTEEDVQAWIEVADRMGPDGKPSMLQDLEANRPSEVGLFSGTVRQLAKKHGLAVPVNDWLYSILSKKNDAL